MKGLPFSNPSGGFWPLGLITVETPGESVAINNNVGKNGHGPMNMPRRIRQLIVSPTPANTKPVYVVYVGYNHTKTNGIIVVVPPGTGPVAIPNGCLLEGVAFNIDYLYLDAEVSGEGAYACAVYG